jgi:hypothetical protein
MRYASWSAAVICRFTWLNNVDPKAPEGWRSPRRFREVRERSDER